MFIGMIFSTFHLFCECPSAYYSEASEVILSHLAERLMPDHSVSSQGLRFHTEYFIQLLLLVPRLVYFGMVERNLAFIIFQGQEQKIENTKWLAYSSFPSRVLREM